MRIIWPILMLACATPAFGQERDADDPTWTATVQGGGLIADNSGNQTYLGLGLSRALGDRLTLGLSGSYTHSQDEGSALLALPSKTYQLRLSADAALGAVSVGGYASYGRRTFSSASYTRRNGAVINVISGGPVLGLGGSLSYDLQVGDALYLSPQSTVSYDRADIARIFTAPGGTRALKDQQSGVTGTAGVSLQKLFGANSNNAIGISAAFAASSNAAAYRAGSAQAPLATSLGGKQADSWVELGASGALALSPDLALTASAFRTAGFADDDGTSITVGIKLAF